MNSKMYCPKCGKEIYPLGYFSHQAYYIDCNSCGWQSSRTFKQITDIYNYLKEEQNKIFIKNEISDNLQVLIAKINHIQKNVEELANAINYLKEQD